MQTYNLLLIAIVMISKSLYILRCVGLLHLTNKTLTSRVSKKEFLEEIISLNFLVHLEIQGLKHLFKTII